MLHSGPLGGQALGIALEERGKARLVLRHRGDGLPQLAGKDLLVQIVLQALALLPVGGKGGMGVSSWMVEKTSRSAR